MRDDFSEATKRLLAARTCNTCSNPGCSCQTTGPQLSPVGAINIGVAAHISAASPGGPRFDPSLGQTERAAVTNGIWLCQNCAKLVDSDSTRFAAAVLSAWKEAAEQAALLRIGRPTYTDSQFVDDKWCTTDYVERAGRQLREAGFRLRWVRAERISDRVDLEGWREVVWQEPEGRFVRFKVRDPECDFLELLEIPDVAV